MQELQMNNPKWGRFGVVVLGLAAWLGLAASAGWAQQQAPPNDNFANAAVLSGSIGTTNGSNVGATVEPGELSFWDEDSDIETGASVWYAWTAPSSGLVTFNAVSSTFDTLLSVYTGDSVDSLTFVPGAYGYNLVSLGISLPVTFTATAGTTYYIMVEGLVSLDGLTGYVESGSFQLDWYNGTMPPSYGGIFHFTSPVYMFGENESGGLPSTASTAYNDWFTNPPPRITITRELGSAGMVHAGYSIVNGWYTNVYITNLFGTNLTFSDPNGTTNVTMTNIVVQNIFGNYSYNQYTTLQVNNYEVLIATNGGGTTVSGSTNYWNVSTNYPANPGLNGTTTGLMGTNGTITTNLFSSTNYFTNVVSSSPGYPTNEGGDAVFNDYRMSVSITPIVQLNRFTNDVFTDGFAPPYPQPPYVVPNTLRVAVVTNAAFDPAESTNLLAPTALATPAYINILTQGDIDPVTGLPATNVVSFDHARLAMRRDGPAVEFYVRRWTMEGSKATSTDAINIRVDYYPPFRESDENNAFAMAGSDEMILQAGSDYAQPSVNPPGGTYEDTNFWDYLGGWSTNVTFTSTSFDEFLISIPITNHNRVQFNKDLMVEIYYPDSQLPPNPPPTDWKLGAVRFAVGTILFNDIDVYNYYDAGQASIQPAGAVDRTYAPDREPLGYGPQLSSPGAKGGIVNAVVFQPWDGNAVIGGSFISYNATPSSRIARVLAQDGTIDTTFTANAGSGFNDFVSALAVDSNQGILVGGAFTSFNGSSRLCFARLLSTGSLDSSFLPHGTGADNTVRAIAVANDGHIFIGGDFTSYNETNRNHIARLNADGSLDLTFDPAASLILEGSIGLEPTVYAIAVQSDGRVIIGGDFMTVNGVSVNNIARLNRDGSLDGTFNPGTGADGPVYALALAGNQVLVGGDFTWLNSLSRSSIGQLNPDGSADSTFVPGAGADGPIFTTALQPDGGIIAAGRFSTFNQTHRMCITRLYTNGLVDSTFMDTAYNQFAGLPRSYYSSQSEPYNYVSSTVLQADGSVLIGGSFANVGGGFTRDDIRIRNNFARLIGGVTPGPGTIGLAASSYSANQSDGSAWITLARQNGNLGPATVSVNPATNAPGPGAAIAGTDFTFDSGVYGSPQWPTTYGTGAHTTWMLSDGMWGINDTYLSTVDPNEVYPLPGEPSPCTVKLTLPDNTNATENVSLNVVLSNPGAGLDGISAFQGFHLGGENIPLGVALGASSAPFSILSDNVEPCHISFSSPTYIVTESNTITMITLQRTGDLGATASVEWSAAAGNAVNGVNFVAASGTAYFGPGAATTTFGVQILQDNHVDPDLTVNLSLGSPGPYCVIDQGYAVLTIVDSNLKGGHVEFTSPTYGVDDDSGYAVVQVMRNGSANSVLQVHVATVGGTAIANTNYVALSTNLVWNNGQAGVQTLLIPVMDDGMVYPGPLTVNLQISAPLLVGASDPQALASGMTNAVLYITNVDSYGQLAFSTPTYQVNENAGYAILTVVRTGGSVGSVSATFATADGTALNGVQYRGTNGTLIFQPGQLSASFSIPLINTGVEDTNYNGIRFLAATLTDPATGNLLSASKINILDSYYYNQPPGGIDQSLYSSFSVNDTVHALVMQSDDKILAGGDFTFAGTWSRDRIARWETNGVVDTNFLASFNGSVLALLCQTDERILVGGQFSQADGVSYNALARLNLDGSLDSSFTPAAGPDNTVFAMAETFVNSNRQLLIGGAFLNYAGMPRASFARINDDGSLDTTFTADANGTVFAIAVQPDGKALIGGDFTTIEGVAYNHIARINVDGSLDRGFNPGSGPGDSVHAIAVQMDGQILIGGLFTNVGPHALNHIARLTSSGQVDTNFNAGLGANDVVTAILVQPDTRILLAGQFTECNGVTRGRITRLNIDGSPDTYINFGTGANSYVSSLAILTNLNRVDYGEIYFGGDFTQYNGQSAPYLAAIFGGAVAGSGAFTFSSPYYSVYEDGTNATITVVRTGGTSGVMSNGILLSNVQVTLTTSDGTAVADTDHRGVTNYMSVTTNLTFAPGEVVQTAIIPVVRDYVITPDLTINLTLTNPLPAIAGGPQLGAQYTAILTNVNVDCGVSFGPPASYEVAENTPSGEFEIPVIRVGGTNEAASVGFYTTTNGTAIPGFNYVPVTNTVTFAPGQVSNTVAVPVIPELGVVEGDKTVVVELMTNATGALLLQPSIATLTIRDVEDSGGLFFFSQTNDLVSEAVGETNGFVSLTVMRIDSQNMTTTLQVNTQNGTALDGINYVGLHQYNLTFAAGQTNQAINIPILQTPTIQAGGFATFSVVLSNTNSNVGFAGGSNIANVVIMDDHVGVGFSSPIYICTETDGYVTLGVNRVGTNVQTLVDYATSDETAKAGTDYTTTTGTLAFNPGATYETFRVPLLRNPQITGATAFNVTLSNARNPSDLSTQVQIFTNNPATVSINDVDTGVFFTNANFGVLKSGTNVTISVARTNVDTGNISVNYYFTNATATYGQDFGGATNGILTFSNGISLQTIIVPILNNAQQTSDVMFQVGLSVNGASSNVQILSPSITTVTITNDGASFQWGAPAFSVGEGDGAAKITVERVGYTNSTVSVEFMTLDATASPVTNFTHTDTNLVFTNGQTIQTVSVPVFNNNIITNNVTVELELTNNTGNSSIQQPYLAWLTIVEEGGTTVTGAGAALLSGGNLTNNGIYPSNQVTLALALRDVGGEGVSNVMATLQTNTVITNAMPTTPTSYGNLVADGPSVWRPFTFTANGTNGQPITVSLNVSYGTNTQLISYNFNLGTKTVSFTNGQTVYIVASDAPPTPASNYPSAISVTGLLGSVTKATVTMTNLSHQCPSDVDMLLVSPQGSNTFLMSKVGGGVSITGVNLTFDDTAAVPLSTNQITNGVYRPTCLANEPPGFLAPAPYSPLWGLYRTNLSVFNGTQANGTWNLFVIDDDQPQSGMISNGWILNLTVVSTLPPAGDLSIGITAPSIAVVSNSMTYTLWVTNNGPSSVSGVSVSDVLPLSVAYVSNTPSIGSASVSASGQLVWNLGSMSNGAVASLAVVVQPQVISTIVNSATVSTLNPADDPNSANNTASLITSVVDETADVALILAGSPNPVLMGGDVTYTLTATNLGPATATAVSIADSLPSELIFVSGTAAGGVTVSGQTVTLNLGDIPAYSETTATLVVRAVAAGTALDTASSTSATRDPNKANNMRIQVKTVVSAMQLGRSGSGFALTWPTAVGTFYVESTTNLASPNWAPDTNPMTQLLGTNTVLIPASSGNKFFRLHAQ
jgi:uncharacterized repeat protein (TIGR01451 family)/uncharacterized delta-60 repeat protein